MRRALAACALASLAGAAAAEDATVVLDTWDARYCEFLLVTGSPGRYEAEIYSTLGLNACDPAAFRAADGEALKRRFGVLAVFKNGPRFWVVPEISLPANDAPVRDFAGIEARLAGLTTVTPAMRLGPPSYLPTAVRREGEYRYPGGLTVAVLDGPDGGTWVMQSYSRAVDPSLTFDDLPGLGTRLRPPAGWSYRTAVLDRDLVVRPVSGSARVVQDELENAYEQCFESACSHRP